MNKTELRTIWKQEEACAHIHGWDFSHIAGRYEAEQDLPWDYEAIVRQYLTPDAHILDYDTGGGEFLLSLKHPYDKTSDIPFADASFDMIINRHGGFDAGELYRLLKKDGIFITQQVGGDNDRELVEMVLPGIPKPYPHLHLETQRKGFEAAGFQILAAEETYQPITFYDAGAFVWFAHIIEWEFPGFSVDNCFEQLLKIHEMIETTGKLQGTTHRFLIVARK